MSNLFKEMPIVFPFYEAIQGQDRYRENVYGFNQYALISPNDSFLPFQIKLPANKPSPSKWLIYGLNGNVLDITNNLNKVNIYNFTDYKIAVYNGDQINFVYEAKNETLNLPCGKYYTVFEFSDGSDFVSEVFTVPEIPFSKSNNTNYIKIDFWNEKDIKPIIYRDNFRQTIYLDTFVASFVPEIEEETEKDGYNNEIPVFQKLVLKYKITEVVPDFIKIALISLQMHDHVLLTTGFRTGEIDRVQVTTQPHEGGGLNDVDLVFEDNMLYKNNCQQDESVVNVTTW